MIQHKGIWLTVRFSLILVMSAFAADSVAASAKAGTRPPAAGSSADTTRAAFDAEGQRIERLAALGRLWGQVKFFHPWLAYRDIDWDAALVSTVPLVDAARTPEEYRQALAQMLRILGDPATKVVEPAPPPAPSPPLSPNAAQPEVRLVESGKARIAVISVHDWRLFGANPAAAMSGGLLVKAFSDSANAQGIVLDLRPLPLTPYPPAEQDMDAWYAARALRADLPGLLKSDVRLAVSRTRLHSGYASATGSNPFYYSAFQVPDHTVLRAAPGPAAGKPIVILTNAASRGLTDLFAGLQASGAATVVHDGSDTAVFLEDVGTPLPVAEGVRVQLRTGELVSPDGSIGFEPAVVVAPGDAALDRAIAIAAGEKPATRAHPPGAMAASPRPDEPYKEMSCPERPYRLLALFRLWNIIHFFYPYQHLLDRPWDEALAEFVPRFERATTPEAYARVVCEMAARMQDTHAAVNIGNRLDLVLGTHAPPVVVRTLRGRVVVTALEEEARAAGIAPGDIVLSVDGMSVERRRSVLAPLLAASTPQALRYRTDRLLLRGGQDSEAVLRVRGSGRNDREVKLRRTLDRPALSRLGSSTTQQPLFTVLPEGFGYVDITRLPLDQVDAAFEKVRATPALIFDMRGYPQGTAFTIGPRLATRRFVAARFQRPIALEPGGDTRATYASEQVFDPVPGFQYRGRIVVLVDERAISQSEHSCLIFETAAPGRVTFVGTPTAGTNGDVTSMVLPGDVRVWFSGHDVRHADGRQLQRVGIRPDVLAEPTPEGIRAGRDEVLEAAIRFLRRGK